VVFRPHLILNEILSGVSQATLDYKLGLTCLYVVMSLQIAQNNKDITQLL